MTAPSPPIRLGINIDHVATLRNARGGARPDPIRAAKLALEAGADGITAHLREDRRHIRDYDIARLKNEIEGPLNLEIAVTEEMVGIALKMLPHACCLVPERRQEITTEGGLDVRSSHNTTASAVQALLDGGIRVSLFIDADETQVEAAAKVRATTVEFHTGAYCEAFWAGNAEKTAFEWDRLAKAATLAHNAGLEVHAGHGLDFNTARHVARIPQIVEFNIGHFLIGEAVFVGLKEAIRHMREAMDQGQADALKTADSS